MVLKACSGRRGAFQPSVRYAQHIRMTSDRPRSRYTSSSFVTDHQTRARTAWQPSKSRWILTWLLTGSTTRALRVDPHTHEHSPPTANLRTFCARTSGLLHAYSSFIVPLYPSPAHRCLPALDTVSWVFRSPIHGIPSADHSVGATGSIYRCGAPLFRSS